jgi:hypothetical protein
VARVDTKGALQDLTAEMPFILVFLGATVLIQMFFGEKVTYYFLILVLLSMLTVNGKKVVALGEALKSYIK